MGNEALNLKGQQRRLQKCSLSCMRHQSFIVNPCSLTSAYASNKKYITIWITKLKEAGDPSTELTLEDQRPELSNEYVT